MKCEHKKIKYSLMEVVLEFENGDLARQRIRVKPRRSIPLNIGEGSVCQIMTSELLMTGVCYGGEGGK